MQSTTFADLGLSAKVQAAIDDAGYTTPTPIQAEAIPVALTGKDVLGIAQTGTGKTASFTLPMISRLETGRARARMPRSLILAPTRELAAQVAQSFEKYGVNHKLNLALLIGGVSMDEQTKKLDRGVDVLIATPGRLIDHFQRGRVMLMGVEILVIDEADRMLDMGFIPDIEKICKLLPPKRQTLFFSATMPPEITRLVDQFMNSPQRIEVARPATTAQTITQRFKFCPDGDDWAKREILREIIRDAKLKNAIIFCNRKRDVAILEKSLTKHGFNAGCLHGDMDQRSRTETLDKFRSGEILLLAASDVAARGLDIPDVSHVFNFDLPKQSEDYVHRIGRTGRAGKEGAAFSLVTIDELGRLGDIEKITGDAVEWVGDAPTDEDREASKSRKRRRGGSSRGKPSSSASDQSASSRGGRNKSSDRGGDTEGKRESRARGGERRRSSGRNATSDAQQPPSAAATHSEPAIKGVAQPGTDQPTISNERPRRGRRPDRAPRNDNNRSSDRETVSAHASASDAPAQQQRKSKSADGGGRKSARGRPSRGQKTTADNGEALRAPEAGFADNIPAFLRRPVKRPTSKPDKSSDTTEAPDQARETKAKAAAE
ncbi:MAG: DEAD/DEAH box helicase [Pseudomonadota bacterium]